jgi:pimeloyl-ACP methyl ester carboxylesterase
MPDERSTVNEWSDRAIVVVHGIGEQRRGNALDALVRGLQRCGAGGGELVQESKPFGEDLPADVVRLTRNGNVADIYEVYWAPHTAHKTTARSVLWWLLRATFLPGSKLRAPSKKTWWDLSAALLAVAAVTLLLLYSLISLGNLSAQVACRTDPDVMCEVPERQRDVTGREVTWGGLGQIKAVFATIAESLELTDRPLAELSPSHAAAVLTKLSVRNWLLLAVAVLLTTQALFRLAQIANGLVQGTRRYSVNKIGGQSAVLGSLLIALFIVIQMLPPVTVAFVFVFVAVGFVLRAARRFLAESLGDVQVYAERDENSEHYAAREAVLKEAERTFDLVSRRGYRHIIVIGHSLGSVIAFTSLDRLARRIPPLLSRIDAFITVGTALEKVRYFFERRKEQDEEAAARLIAPAKTIATGRAWLNLWYANDVVADPITTFATEGVECKGYRWPDVPATNELLREARRGLVVNIDFGYPILRLPLVWTHSRYWGDHTVMTLITDVAFGSKDAPVIDLSDGRTPVGRPRDAGF